MGKAEYKIINVNIFNPAAKTVKARCEKLYCNNSENCKHYKENRCVNQRQIFSSIKCPHSKNEVEEGYTQRAKNFYNWQRKRKEQYKEHLNVLTIYNQKLAECGDYIYLPYPYLKNYVNSLPFIVNEYFCDKEDFTLENILKIIRYKPQAMMGGTITKFQEEYSPKFIQHLAEEFPEIYKELISNYPEIMKNYQEKAENYEGRKAYIKTLKTGAIIKEKGNEFIWDGETLTCEDYKDYFLPFQIKQGQLILTPSETDTLEITNNNQVDSGTKFKD